MALDVLPLAERDDNIMGRMQPCRRGLVLASHTKRPFSFIQNESHTDIQIVSDNMRLSKSPAKCQVNLVFDVYLAQKLLFWE